jgi:formyl-CoA transferase
MSTAEAEATGPLKGLRVIELGVLLAGPFCGQLLGDLGAEVIKIEPPGQGDPMRDWGTIKPKGQGLWFPIVARNKKCITANMRTPEGQQILKDLVVEADFVLENFRPGTMEKWGLGYDVLSTINPGIIMIRVSGYGQTGPSSHKAGYASVGEAMGGLRYVMGEPDRMPSRAGISIGDTLAATYATIGALAALEHRRKTGRGQVVDAAIYESCFAMMESLIPDDPRYATHIARGEHQGELDAMIGEWTHTQTCEALEVACEAGGVPCGRIYRAPEMLMDEHFAAREAIVEVEHPVLGAFKMQNVFPKLSETPGNVRWTGPDMGTHTLDVLHDILGYDDTKIEALKAANAI